MMSEDVDNICFINGKVLRGSEASIGVADLGLQRGYAVFDFARTYNDKLFHFPDHLDRLHQSAAALQLELPYSDERITDIATELIKESDFNNPAIRLLLTGGYVSGAAAFSQPNFIMIAEDLSRYPSEIYSHGGTLMTVEYQRELPHIKSINYLNSLRLEPLKRERGAFDILYYSGESVTECPRSNFFIFRGATLVAPRDNILLGITRKLILRLAQKYFQIEERAVAVQELRSADEAFVTSTTKRVIPITGIDTIPVGTGVVGERTRTLMRLFAEYTENC